MNKAGIVVLLAWAATAGTRAQTPSPRDAAPSLDVASIRVNRSGESRVSGGFLPGGRYRVTNYSLRSLIAAAFVRPQINPDFLIAGGPDWIDTARFDIDAKADGEFPAGADGPSAPRRVMLQHLLAERFGLRVHTEPKDVPVYALTRVRDDRLGHQLRDAASACTAAPPATCRFTIGPGVVVMHGATLSQLLNLLPRFVDGVVIDRTGLHAPVVAGTVGPSPRVGACSGRVPRDRSRPDADRRLKRR